MQTGSEYAVQKFRVETCLHTYPARRVYEKKKYEKNSNVILCDSLQSIEYWFLLHFEDTCRHFQDSAATERALKRYLPTYNKTRKYLEKDSWVRDMNADARMKRACELAEKYQGRDSYSEIYKAIKKGRE